VLLCDGRVVCGCADPFATRVLGDTRHASLADVWTGATIRSLRADLNGGGSRFCGDCPLKLPLDEGRAPTVRAEDAGQWPRRLYVECTAACNISCFEAYCAPERGITRSREAGMLDFNLFTRIIDEAGPHLVRVDFFNYGEAFLHKRAVEMCAYIKHRYPHIYLYTSTNGLMLTGDLPDRLVDSGIDEVTFSIDGATPESYARYRQRGDFDRVIGHLRRMIDAKRARGRDVPFVNWRYILFRWNDSDVEMRLAQRMADDIGVDRLCWEITDHPESAYSRRFVPGSESFDAIKHAVWDDNNLGNAIPGATPRARIEVLGHHRSQPIHAKPGEELLLRTRVRNLTQRRFPAHASYGRRLVRLGAQLCDASGATVNRDLARAWLPATVDPGGRADVPISLTVPETAGAFRLKFDLVYEGIDWFEDCGSEPTVRELIVE
jgi:hypothetical protein